ncbi:hypothetical protein DPMN_086740 [Dreissena polymorpha]|uniref:Uncharacterized protein n=1 Tax=Dreissena polymorpha TaxID=45954 RepID=A0A9D4KSF2_DREPO|nr:hypothetical protein DPMN_086740 [Dreissena polymorpha]
MHITKKYVTSKPYCYAPFSHVVQQNRNIICTYVPNKFHEDWTQNVTSRLFTRFHNSKIKKTILPPSSHVKKNWNHFQTHRDIITTNVLHKVREDWTLTLTKIHYRYIRKTALSQRCNVIQRKRTIFNSAEIP